MCQQTCLVVHALCGVIYTGAGSILIVAGLFFFITTPLLQLGSNILTGGLCIVFGVGSVLLTCCGVRDVQARRIDKLLGCTLFVLTACVANIVVLEVGEWWLLYDRTNLREVIEMLHIEQLAYYGHIVPSLTTLAVMAVAFLDAHFLYCTYSVFKPPRMRHVHINETVSDIEYIIPRHKTRPMGGKHAAGGLSHYTQSWVFDTEASSQAESPYLMLPPSTSSDPPKRHQPPSPVISVQVESDAEDTPEVGRQLRHMKSFSRTHSPGAVDDSDLSSSTSQPPIYECLERLTRPNVYRSRLDTYINESDVATRPSSARADYHRQSAAKAVDAPQATFMAELGRSISNKQSNETNSCNSDTDFSQELEAALKLIQDLESPNTIDTPSESFRPIAVAATDEPRPDSAGSSRSSKTLSGHNSLNGDNGKLTSGLTVESLSTSGYNSPTLSNRTTPEAGMACVIRHVGPTARISIFPASSPALPTSCVSAPATPKPPLAEVAMRRAHARTLSAGDAMKNVLGKMRGLLKTRRPSLAPDLERAVLKSESLAFLTDGELEDRLQRTWDVHRRIEAKVKQDMSMIRRWESFGSIEDIMDKKGFSQL